MPRDVCVDSMTDTPVALGRLTGVALLLLFLPAVQFWRPDWPYFYILDDWTALIQMTHFSFWTYLTQPDGEQWFPFFHAVYYVLVHLAGERYTLLVLLNCLCIGLNSFLLFLFCRRFWGLTGALVVSVIYNLAAANHAVAWNAFYLCYLLSLTFFLSALLLTDSYHRQPGGGKIIGIGLCALLSILSHNYTLLGLVALPLYLLLLGGTAGRRQAGVISVTLVGVYLLFTLGYLHFAGLPALTSHNQEIISRLPGPVYFWHLFNGAILSPFLYLVWGHYHFPVWAYVGGVTLLAVALGVVLKLGTSRDRRLCLWALLANLLPFILVSLARYQRSVGQAFVARYGIFTLIGALIILMTAWRLLYLRNRHRTGLYIGSGLVVGCILAGQFLSLSIWEKKYLEMWRLAAICYDNLTSPESLPALSPEQFNKFCPTAHPTLSPEQMLAIRQFLAPPP